MTKFQQPVEYLYDASTSRTAVYKLGRAVGRDGRQTVIHASRPPYQVQQQALERPQEALQALVTPSGTFDPPDSHENERAMLENATERVEP